MHRPGWFESCARSERFERGRFGRRPTPHTYRSSYSTSHPSSELRHSFESYIVAENITVFPVYLFQRLTHRVRAKGCLYRVKLPALEITMMMLRCEGVEGSVSGAEEDDSDSNRVSKLYLEFTWDYVLRRFECPPFNARVGFTCVSFVHAECLIKTPK